MSCEEPAYLLHKRPYRNTSLLLELYSEHFGRMSVVAKGIKQSKLPLYRYCQPFLPLLVSWVGRSELKTLTALELEPQAVPIKLSDGQSLMCGLYLNELMTRLVPVGEGYPELFAGYRQAIEGLANAQGEVALNQSLEAVLRRFEIQLLAELGYGVDFEYDANGLPLEPHRCYYYQPQEGFIAQSDYPDSDCDERGNPIQHEQHEQHVQRVQRGEQQVLVPGSVLCLMAKSDLSDLETLRWAKRLMREILAIHLGPKPLNVRALTMQSINVMKESE